MNNIIKPARHHIANNIKDMDTPCLIGELKRVLTFTVDNIAYLGEIWRELDYRGVDLSAHRQGMGRFLPLIASGQLAPEAMLKFIGNMTILRSIQNLPINEQKKLAAGKKIKIAELTMDGCVTKKEIEAEKLTPAQAKIVFDYGRIRPIDEQENMIAGAISSVERKKRKKEPAARKYSVNVDIKAKTIKIGKMSVPTEVVIDALRKSGLIN